MRNNPAPYRTDEELTDGRLNCHLLVYQERQGLIFLMYPNKSMNKVRTDSQTTIDWVLGSTPTRASRHLETRIYSLRHRYGDGVFTLEHVATDNNVADIRSFGNLHRRYWATMLLTV